MIVHRDLKPSSNDPNGFFRARNYLERHATTCQWYPQRARSLLEEDLFIELAHPITHQICAKVRVATRVTFEVIFIARNYEPGIRALLANVERELRRSYGFSRPRRKKVATRIAAR